MSEILKKTTGTMVAFGDAVQLSKERSQDPEADGFDRYIGLEHLEPSDLKVRSWGDIADGTTFTNVFRPGQVLFGKRRAYQRKVAVADFSGVCSGDIYVLEPKADHLLPGLLPFICQSEPFYDYVISMSQGRLSPRVNWKALIKYEFALPPLEEQRRIAEVMMALEKTFSLFVTCKVAGESVLSSLLLSIISTPDKRSSEVRVGELLDLKYGKGLPETNRDGGQYAVYGSSGIAGHHSQKLVDGPVIIVGRKGSAGAVVWCNESCWPIDTTFWVKNKSSLPYKLVYFLLKGLELSRFAEQTAMPGLDRNRVHEVRLSKQAVDEPEVTLSRLNIVEEAIVSVQKRIEAILQVKRALLASSLTQGERSV